MSTQESTLELRLGFWAWIIEKLGTRNKDRKDQGERRRLLRREHQASRRALLEQNSRLKFRTEQLLDQHRD